MGDPGTSKIRETGVRLGRSTPEELGPDAVLVLVPVAERADESSVTAVSDLPEGAQYRVVPLFAVLDLPSDDDEASAATDPVIVVGEVRVLVNAKGAVTLRAVLGDTWQGPRTGASTLGAHSPSGAWRATTVHDDRLLEALRARFEDNAHDMPETRAAVATTVAKAIAETSRNDVGRLQELRYAVERRLGLHLRRELNEDLELVLADVVELLRVAGRARDLARASVRSGLMLWLNDAPMYHAQRRRMDPSLVERAGSAAAQSDPAFSTYDAGVRQCISLENQLTEEMEILHGLLSSGSTIAAARNAQAQENFNLVATVSAVALGLPALILALYGASDFLPFSGPLGIGGYRLLIPVCVAGVVAAGLAAALPGSSSPVLRFWRVMAGTIALLVLLGVAGRYASANTDNRPTFPPTPSTAPGVAPSR